MLGHPAGVEESPNPGEKPPASGVRTVECGSGVQADETQEEPGGFPELLSMFLQIPQLGPASVARGLGKPATCHGTGPVPSEIMGGSRRRK